MQLTITNLLSALAVLHGADALGINCRGSSECDFSAGGAVNTLIDTMKNASSFGHGNDNFASGAQIACIDAEPGNFLGEPGICAFFQSGASGTLDQAIVFAEQIQGHKCKECGSVPTNPGNDVSKGQLTFNFVDNQCCSPPDACYCLTAPEEAPHAEQPDIPTDEPFGGGVKV